MDKRFLILLLVVFCTGCGRRVARPMADIALPGGDAPALQFDSLFVADGCSELTCYFAAGMFDREALETVARILYEGFAIVPDFEHCRDVESVEKTRMRMLDSLKSLAWPDGETWAQMRRTFLAWSEQQIDRFYLVFRAERDATCLVRPSETDSMVLRCGNILLSDENHFVDSVRCLLRGAIVAGTSGAEHRLERIEALLQMPDSVRNARKELFNFLSNHLNRKIHARLGRNGMLSFQSYEADFLRLFDSVKVETWEP